MKTLIFAASILLCTQPGFALLSPLNQSIEEIQSIVQNTELQKRFPQDQPLMEIQRSGNGYLLTNGTLQMFVEIQYIPIERPGRQQYKLVFHETTPITKGAKP